MGFFQTRNFCEISEAFSLAFEARPAVPGWPALLSLLRFHLHFHSVSRFLSLLPRRIHR